MQPYIVQMYQLMLLLILLAFANNYLIYKIFNIARPKIMLVITIIFGFILLLFPAINVVLAQYDYIKYEKRIERNKDILIEIHEAQEKYYSKYQTFTSDPSNLEIEIDDLVRSEPAEIYIGDYKYPNKEPANEDNSYITDDRYFICLEDNYDMDRTKDVLCINEKKKVYQLANDYYQ